MGENIARQIALYGDIQMLAGILALLFLTAAAVLFFRLHIPQVVGELTGKRAKKEIRRMASDASGSGRTGKTFGSSAEKGKARGSGRRNGGDIGFSDPGTEKLRAPETAVMSPSDFAVEQTILLIHTDETT